MSILAHGNTIAGIPVSDVKLQGVTTLNQAEAYGLIRPSYLERLTQAQAKQDAKARAAEALRKEVQRPFDKARRDNAEIYAEYIRVGGEQGDHGGVPAITLFIPPEAQGSMFDNGVEIPYNQAIVALDGETQTEARFILRDQEPESGNWPVAVTVYVGITYKQAAQIVHDYNTYANPIPESKIGVLNADGPMSVAAHKLYSDAGIRQEEISRFSAKPSKKEKVANAQVMAAIGGYAMPMKALAANINRTFKALNRPVGAKNINGAADNLAPFVGAHLNVSRTAPPAVWQVAGALVAEKKRTANQINWAEGIAAYEATKPPKGQGQGGKRMPSKERMEKIAEGLLV